MFLCNQFLFSEFLGRLSGPASDEKWQCFAILTLMDGKTRMMNTEDIVNPWRMQLRAHSKRKISRDTVALAFDLLPLADFACLVLSGYLGTLIYCTAIGDGVAADVWSIHKTRIIILALLAPVILYDRKLCDATGHISLWILAGNTVKRFIKFSGAALTLGFLTHSLVDVPRGLVVTWLAIGVVLVTVLRMLLIRELRVLERIGVLCESVAIVGAGPVADRLIQQLLHARPDSMEIVGIFDDRMMDPATHAMRQPAALNRPVGTLQDLLDIGKTRKIDWVLLTMPCTAENRLLSMIHTLKALSVPVGLCPENVGLLLPYRMINYVADGLPVTLLADRPIRHWAAIIKSAEDVLLGGLLLLLLLPIIGLIALAIRFEGAGPILFRQPRHGANNDVFNIFKFRTMRWSADAVQAPLKQTSVDDMRITPLGRLLRKTSLDELPQLFNVLRGEMSLVGPRPHAVNMRTEDRLGHEITDDYPHRHRVKPGMTGWAQVNGSRGATETREQLRRRVELDIQYVENWSLLFDIKILLMTFWVVLRGTNAR